MAGYSTSNPKELKDAILRRLGAPIINVEVTEAQIYDCISRAIELYTEYHPDGLNRTFITVVLDEQQAASGIIQFDKRMYAVTKVLRGDFGGAFTFSGTPLDWFIHFVNNLAGGVCQTSGPYGSMDLQTYSMYNQYFQTLQDQLNPIQDFWFNSTSNTIRVLGNIQPGQVLVFEAWAYTAMLVDESSRLVGNPSNIVGMGNDFNYVEAWDNPYENLKKDNLVGNTTPYADQGVFNVRWVKDYSTALVKELNGHILRKHQGMQLPGGITIDGQSILAEAKEEISRLREELLQLSEPLPILWG